MKLLVTGGAGYIGSHTCKALAGAGHEVLVYDNLSTGHREFVRWGDFCHGDVRDTQNLRRTMATFRPDGVIHFAASIEAGESVINPGKYYSNNAGGVLSVLEAMRDEDVPAIVVSGTCAVYGKPERLPITEACPTAPINPYGASKLFMERMLEDFATAHGLKWMSLRYFNAAGSSAEGEIGERHNPETHLIPRVMMAALNRIPAVDVLGTDYPTADGTCIRDYVHVDDLASAHLAAIAHLHDNGESLALNLGSGRGSSVREIIAGIEELAGTKIPVNYAPRRPGDSPMLLADSARAAEVLGWKPEKDLDAILEHAWNFMVAH